jgi:hypothetical protein
MLAVFDDPTVYRTELSREKQLWCAVIVQAVQDALRQPGPLGLSREHGRLKDEALRWFSDNGEDFRRACEAADFDPEFLRNQVLRLAQAATMRNAPRQGAAAAE